MVHIEIVCNNYSVLDGNMLYSDRIVYNDLLWSLCFERVCPWEGRRGM